MNYIILGKSVGEVLRTKYDKLGSQYQYAKAFDSYIKDQMSFDGVYRLHNRCSEDNEYQLIGRGCSLSMELSRKYRNCFYAKWIKFFDKEKQYFEQLAQTLELPGEWDVAQFEDSYYLDAGTYDIADFLTGLKIRYRDYKTFEDKWKNWDLYNTKLREREEKLTVESEAAVDSVILENGIFSIRVKELPKRYEEKTGIGALFNEENRFCFLGTVAAVDRQLKQIDVVCDSQDVIKRYEEKRIGKIEKLQIIDKGARARIDRQRKAMSTLFQNEAVNGNIREIFMGNFPCSNDGQEEQARMEQTMRETVELFGSNMQQKKAYAMAVNAPDICLIQGPPGTGKTTIITEIVRRIIQNGEKVLITSETNIAVDNVLERIRYTKNVVPVRLGKEERIEKNCIPFMPDKIVYDIINGAKEQNTRYDKQGVSLENLISEQKEKWEKIDKKMEEEIERLRKTLTSEYTPEKLLVMIDRFEKLVLVLNDIHNSIKAEKPEYDRLNKKRLENIRKKAALEEELLLEETQGMSSGMGTESTPHSSHISQIKRQLSNLNSDIEKTNCAYMGNRYEALMSTYKRKMRLYGRKCQELSDILGVDGSLLSAAHQAKNRIEDMRRLEEQRENARADMEANIARLASDSKHKQELWEISRDIRTEWMEALDYIETKKEIERIYINRTNAIFATCEGIASSDSGIFSSMEYDYVIVDEAAKCNMLDILIPIVRGEKIILVGDHKQLYPMLDMEGLEDEMDEKQLEELKEHILFKWLYEEIVPRQYKIMLDRQYRMGKTISEFVSENFYDGSLQCEKDKDDSYAMIWIDSETSAEQKMGKSYINIPEAELTIQLLMKLDREYEADVAVGVICTYKAQANYISERLKNIKFSNINVECSTVDAFQGKEKHTIIFDIGRSSRITKFIRDMNRVNVAVSRSQEYCYVIGKSELMRRKDAGILGKLYQYIRMHDGLRNERYVR